MSNMRPMRATKVVDLERVQYPVLMSPKIDGIRCYIDRGVAMSKKKKRLPNLFVQAWAKRNSKAGLSGMDGELVVGGDKAAGLFNKTSSGIMSTHGEPNFTYHVFDIWDAPSLRYDIRLNMLKNMHLPERVYVVKQKIAKDAAAVLAYEAEMLALGYEGVMLRSLDGHYKYGTSTVNEGYLLKLKRFDDDEAEVIGYSELEHNENEKVLDEETGRMRRPTFKAGKVGGGVLGKLRCRNKDGVEFGVGSGFDASERVKLWNDRKTLVGRLIKYKFQPTPVGEAPRFPVFLGFRDPSDL